MRISSPTELTSRAATAITAAVLLLAPAPPQAAAAGGNVEIIVASDRTEAGKNFVPPTAQKRAYYRLATAGPQELGAFYAGDPIPPQQIIEPLLIKALARQFYFLADETRPNIDYVIIYAWGTINPDSMDLGGQADRFSETQHVLNRSQRQMLSIVSTNKVDVPPRGLVRDRILSTLADGRYFLLVAAYDYDAMASGKRPRETMLWRTRLSVYNLIGINLAAAIPLMLDAAPGAFGADGYPKTVRGKLRDGRVEIGDPKIVDYITGTTAAPPPAPVTTGTSPAKPASRKLRAPK